MWLRCPSIMLALATIMLAVATWSSADATTGTIVGAARVYGDGSLRIGPHTIRLFGIYVPPAGKTCNVILRPTRCGSRAAIALDLKIQGFVHCVPIAENVDGSVSAVCYVRRTFRSMGDDLGAFLLMRGLALASPDAPFEYAAMERIARARGLGVWGFPADSITFR